MSEVDWWNDQVYMSRW